MKSLLRRSRSAAVISVSALLAATLTLVTGPMAGAAPAANSKVPVATGINIASLPGVVAFGSTPASTPETVSFVLVEQNGPQLEATVLRGVKQYLSVAQFAQTYGQSQYNISQLQTYLSQFGITTQVYADNIDVVATGDAGQFDAALGTQQEQYYVPARPGRSGGPGALAQMVHGNTTPPELPYRLAQYVAAILGLTNYDVMSSNAVHMVSSLKATAPGNGNACVALTTLPDACNTPETFAANYGLTPLYQRGAAGAGQSIGIVTFAALDVGAPEYFWQNVLGLPTSNRTVAVDNVDGGPGAPSFEAGTGETDLDVEQSGGVAPGANVIVYQAPGTDYGFVDGFLTAASQDIAGSVSCSWGSSEAAIESAIASSEESPGFQDAFDESFLELAVQGQSTFVATGDAGAYLATEDIGTTNLSVGTPADSPFVTATGATTLPWSDTFTGPSGEATVSVPSQRAWGWDYLWQPIATIEDQPLATVAESLVAGSTGGFSTLEKTPSYQQGVPGTNLYSAVPYLTPTDYQQVGGLTLPTAWNFNPSPPVIHGFGQGRAVPDVSTDGDPETGYLEYSPSFAAANYGPSLEGGWGGTSFVAPELNGSTAVIDSLLGRRVGFWNPAVYSFATQGSSPFTPLDQSGTGNDNIYYSGTPGTVFNEATGLGYPDLAKLAADFGGGPRF